MITSKLCLVTILLTLSTFSFAQVGIGTTNPKAVLDINSASSGILMPRLTTKERLAIENPAQALTVYDLDLGCFTFWHNNQWHCLCGENDVVLPGDDEDDDDDGIRDTDEIANCIANGEDVIFTVTDVPNNYTEQYYTIKGNYYTNCGVGTWTFEKPKFIPGYKDEINFTYFANSDDDDNSKPVGIIKDNKQVYFNFNTTRSDEFKLYGTFLFNGPPIIPVIEGYSGYQYDEYDKYRAEIDQISFSWNENTKGKYYDPNTDLNKGLHNKTYESGNKFDIREIYGNNKDKNPYHRQLTWHVELGETNTFVLETGTGRRIRNLEANKAEGFGLRAISSSSTNYSFNDNDGIASSLDIDSDNDGIYDVVEAGFKAYDTNGDGILNSNDNGYLDTNNNGMHDTLENLTPKDTNGNGVLDAYELDADSDTCLDVYEAGFTDTNNDGFLDGTGIDNSNGKVTGNTDGYTDPGLSFQDADTCDIPYDCNTTNSVFSKGLSLNGTNQYATHSGVGNSNNPLYFTSNSWSNGVLFKRNFSGTGKRVLWSQASDNQSNLGYYELYIENHKIHFKLFTKDSGNSSYTWQSNVEFPSSSEWYAIAVTYNGNRNNQNDFKFWKINPTTKKATPLMGTWTIVGSPFINDKIEGFYFLGRSYSSNLSLFKGTIAYNGLTTKNITSSSEISNFVMNPKCWIESQNGTQHNAMGNGNAMYTFDAADTEYYENDSAAKKTAKQTKIWLMGSEQNCSPDKNNFGIRNQINPGYNASCQSRNDGDNSSLRTNGNPNFIDINI